MSTTRPNPHLNQVAHRHRNNGSLMNTGARDDFLKQNNIMGSQMSVQDSMQSKLNNVAHINM